MSTNQEKIKELKKLIFSVKQPSKQDKNKLFKLAKLENDLETIEKLAYQLNFQKAQQHLKLLNKNSLNNNKIKISKNTEKVKTKVFNKISKKKASKLAEIDSIEFVDRLIQQGVIVGNRDDEEFNNVSLLYISAHNGNTKIAKFAIKEGADLNFRSNYDITPLMIASRQENVEVLELLLDHGADCDLQDDLGMTALMYASFTDHIETVELLLKNGANPNIKNTSNETALMMAIAEKNNNVVKILLKETAKNINLAELYLYEDNLENIDIALKYGAYINSKSLEDELTCLEMASHYGLIDYVKLLISHNAINEETGKAGQALLFAVENNHQEIARLLIENYADINFQNKSGDTALQYATNKPDVEITNLLLEYKAIDVNIQNENGHTALMFAVSQGNLNIVKLLLDSGADSSIRGFVFYDDDNDTEVWGDDGTGDTALVTACNQNDFQTNDNLEMIKLLLSYRKSISFIEAGYLDTLLFNNDIAKIASSLLVVEDDAKDNAHTLLFHTIRSNTAINDIFNRFSFSDKRTQEEKEKDSDEYIKYNILIKCDNLLKNGVDIHYKNYNEITVLEYTKDRYPEIAALIQGYIENVRSKELQGMISFNDDKFSIQLNGNKYVFIDMNIQKIWKLTKCTDEKNKYKDDEGNFFLIQSDKIFYQSSDKIEEYKLKSDSITGNVLEVSNNHNPKSLVEILCLFTQDNPIKYSAHSFEWSRYGSSYDTFMHELKIAFDEVAVDLEQYSPNLYKKIFKFLIDDTLSETNTWGMSKIGFGWSSSALSEWCRVEDSKVNGKKAIYCDQIPTTIIDGNEITNFDGICDIFKNEIEIRDDDKLSILFANLKSNILEFDFEVRYKNLEGIAFYTDVENFIYGLTIIFEQFTKKGRKEYDLIEVEALPDENGKYVDIKIVQLDSLNLSQTSEDMKDQIKDGDFLMIYDYFKSLCEWKIESIFKDGSFIINYLSTGLECTTKEPSTNKPRGFTHTLRFYKC